MTQTGLTSSPAALTARGGDREELPRRVGQWELVSLAAEGGLARVYRARPTGSAADRPPPYALKMLRPRWQQDPRAVGLLEREALVGRAVSHPHLISILQANLGQPPQFVVMPWLDGSTVRARLEAGRRIDLPVALWITRQVAEALEALHAAGWMHGDVKPGNVFISPQGHATLLDLGFARREDETGSAVDRLLTATCNYIAPELVTSALRADIRSDIYSLGVVLFELTAGRLPFTGDSLAELAQQHKQARPPNLRHLAPHLPDGVVRLVQQMLAKEPLRRPQTPLELIERLAALEIATFSERAFG
ncbi:MAG: serine/threonine-protein kinase [Planctomycetota bacterium]|jgi:serine/threonine-protein kinase